MHEARRGAWGLWLVAVVASLGLVTPGLARPFTAEDLVAIDRLSSVKASPDGKWIAYNIRSRTATPNGTEHALWIVPAGGRPSEAKRLVQGLKANAQPQWAPDGRSIYFLGTGEGARQIWRIGVEGGTPAQITRSPVEIEFFKLSPDGRTLVFSADVHPDCPTLECTRARLESGQGRSANIVYRDMGVRFYDEWEDELRRGLFSAPVAGGAPVPLTRGLWSDIPEKPGGDEGSFTFAPDGGSIIFAAQESRVSNSASPAQDLYRVPVDGTAPPQRLGVAGRGSAYNPVVSPDGKLLAYLHDRVAHSDGARAAIMVRPLGGGSVRELGAGFDRSPQRIGWSRDGRSVYGIVEDAGQQKLFDYDLTSGKAKALTGDGSVEEFDALPGGAVYVRSDFGSPAQVYSLARGASPRRLTNIAAGQLDGVAIAPHRSFTFAGWNGDIVQGFVVEPLDRRPGRKYPVVFVIHGGPHGAYNNAWSYLRNPQIWAGRGYATVLINFHGSTGFGEAFSQAVHGHWGDRPLEDLQKGWAAALRQFPYLDGDRACALGSSYGGYMVNWIAGNWSSPWRCFVSHAGVFDVRAGGLSGDLVWYKDLQMAGSPIRQPEAYERFNPRNHVGRWTKPILFTHGGRDLRVTVNESVSGHIAAQRLGLPSEFLYMPDANHLITRPQDTLDWYQAVNAWLDRWTAPQGATFEAATR